MPIEGGLSLLGIFFYFSFFIFWAAVCYMDYKLRKIDNRAIVMGCLLLVALFYFNYPRVPFMFLLGHWLASLGVALMLWRLKVWPSGDAKLFALLSTAVFLYLPAGAIASLNLIFTQLVNIFVLSALFFIPLSLSILLRNGGEAGASDGIRRMAAAVNGAAWPSFYKGRGCEFLWDISFMVFTYCVSLLFYRLIVPRIGRCSILVVVLALRGASVFLRGAFWSGPHRGRNALCASAGVIALSWRQFSADSLPLYFDGMVKIIVLNYALQIVIAFLDYYMNKMETVRISREDLRPSLILADSFVRRLGSDKSFNLHEFAELYPDGLTREQAWILKDWCLRRRVDQIDVYKTHPFAFWIFLGAFITLIARRDVVYLFDLGLIRLMRGWLGVHS